MTRKLLALCCLLLGGIYLQQTAWLLYQAFLTFGIQGWMLRYVFEVSAFIVPLTIGFFAFAYLLWFKSSRAAIWCSLLLLLVAAGHSIIYGLYLHYVVLPPLMASSGLTPYPYFNFSQLDVVLLTTLPHLLLHVLIPIGLLLCVWELIANRSRQASHQPRGTTPR
ncbi:MAG: hypothetical protein AAGK14_05915 [Verrucomicrobiota bacterium]